MNLKTFLELLKLLWNKWWQQPYWYVRHLRREADRRKWEREFPYQPFFPESWHDRARDGVGKVVLVLSVPMGGWVIVYSIIDPAGAESFNMALQAYGY